MVDTAGTLCNAAGALKEHGAASVLAYCTHAVLSGPAVERISGLRARRAGRDRHHSAAGGRQELPKIRQLSVAELLGRDHAAHQLAESVSSLYLD